MIEVHSQHVEVFLQHGDVDSVELHRVVQVEVHGNAVIEVSRVQLKHARLGATAVVYGEITLAGKTGLIVATGTPDEGSRLSLPRVRAIGSLQPRAVAPSAPQIRTDFKRACHPGGAAPCPAHQVAHPVRLRPAEPLVPRGPIFVLTLATARQPLECSRYRWVRSPPHRAFGRRATSVAPRGLCTARRRGPSDCRSSQRRPSASTSRTQAGRPHEQVLAHLQACPTASRACIGVWPSSGERVPHARGAACRPRSPHRGVRQRDCGA